MATKKRAKREQPIQNQSLPITTAMPFWKKPWLWLIGSIAALALLLTNVSSILSNARSLPSEVQKTSSQFFSWYGEYEEWKGHWSNHPEGIVDLVRLNLSPDPFRINIDETLDGQIGGTIETKGICEKIPYFDQLLFDGTISNSDDAYISVFDYIDGYRKDFAKIRLKRDDQVMTVIPIDDLARIFPKQARIARDPDEFSGSEDRELICPAKREDLIVRLRKK